MRLILRENWYSEKIDDTVDMSASGVYQWEIEGCGIYVGKAKFLRKRLQAYPRNLWAMVNDRFYHGNPVKDFRVVHKALKKAYEGEQSVTVRVLENCPAAQRAQRERHWIAIRREQEKLGGPTVLNSN